MTLAKAVDWQAGDRIVVTTRSLILLSSLSLLSLPYFSSMCGLELLTPSNVGPRTHSDFEPDHSEEVTITSVSGGGTIVNFSPALQFPHWVRGFPGETVLTLLRAWC
jgi:hypothetical protein